LILYIDINNLIYNIMIRLYSNKMPVSGEIVVVRITAFDDHTLIINASLLEYGGINGMICRTETSRNSAKRYKRLSVGKVIPVLCSAVDVKPNGDIFVDLNYVTFDKEQYDHYIERYNRFSKLVDSFTWMTAMHLGKLDDIEYDKLIEDPDIYDLVKKIIKTTLHTLTKDEIDELFFKQTIKLHREYIPIWKEHIPIDDFEGKMLIRFPLPNMKIDLDILFSSLGCNGVKKLQTFCENFDTFIKEQLDNSSITFYNLTSPHFRFNISSPSISDERCVVFEDSTRTYLETITTENPQITASVMSCKLVA